MNFFLMIILAKIITIILITAIMALKMITNMKVKRLQILKLMEKFIFVILQMKPMNMP